jgi:hypothetical protein
MSEERAKNKPSILAIILFGFLSTIFAEVFSGSSPLWFLDAWGWFVTLPLYSAHALLLINLAMRFERTSITQLYLWGILFGLYEGWITKVIWAGYIGDVPLFGTFLGFAVAEFMVIALFWHAVFSFILPILVFQILMINTNKGEAVSIHTSHLQTIANTTGNKILLGIFVVVISIFVATPFNGDTLSIIVAAGVNFAYIFALSWVATTWNKRPLGLDSLKIGNRGLSIIVVYLIALYGLMFLTLLPERIPSITTILLTIGFYALVVTMIFVTPRDTRRTVELPSGILSFGNIAWAFLMIMLLTTTWGLLPVLVTVLWSVLYLGMIFMGPVIFILAVVMVIFKARAGRQQSTV